MLGYLIFKPNSIHDIGFQLSFLTVGALALFLKFEPPAEHGLVAVIKRQTLDLAKASLVASLASAPLVAYHFGQFSIISVIANLAIAPLIAPILVCGLVGLGISPMMLAVAAGLMRVVVGPLLDALQVIVQFFGSLPFAAIEVPEFSAYWLLPIYGSMLLAWRKHVRPA
jgi:competence protein ComEC